LVDKGGREAVFFMIGRTRVERRVVAMVLTWRLAEMTPRKLVGRSNGFIPNG
jgi:hypothetical protein